MESVRWRKDCWSKTDRELVQGEIKGQEREAEKERGDQVSGPLWSILPRDSCSHN